MSDTAAAAPAAPASAPSSTPTAPSAPATSAQTSAPVRPTPPRVNGGKFGPKDGGAAAGEGGSAENAEAKPQPTEAQKEAWRLKTKLKVFGKEEEIDYDEEDVVRDLQQLRALRKQFGPAVETSKKAHQVLELLGKSPIEALAAAGHDVKALARQMLAQEAKVEAMSPEERRAYELEQELNALKSERQQEQEVRQKAEREAKNQEIAERNEQRYMGLLQKSGLQQTHENLFYLVETDSLMRKRGVELNDEQLLGETNRRMGGVAKGWLKALPVEKAVQELGPEFIQAVLQHMVAQHEEKHRLAPPAPVASVEAPKKETSPGFLTESEVNARLRRMNG